MSKQSVLELEQERLESVATAAGAALTTVDLRMVYPMGKREVPALRGVDLVIRAGEFVTIMGPSGCGKSTLLHVIGGLLTPSAGRVWVAGEELTRMSDAERTHWRQKKIGFVFQRFNLFSTLTVDGNVELAQRIAANGDFDAAESRIQRDEVLHAVGLSSKRAHKANELSGGEQQRVALARAVINRPTLLLADEPTGSLDSESSSSVLGLLKELHRSYEQTIVMITHDPWASSYSDRVIYMKDGRIDA